ncbi:MAG: hypothetical protein MUF00_10890 [Gemmatimonadaceae bacterium]|nr:hypothetical protein [Gemmatimonadaceae bacterium]
MKYPTTAFLGHMDARMVLEWLAMRWPTHLTPDAPKIIMSGTRKDLPKSDLEQIPGPLFKLMETRFARGLLRDGTVRVGTLLDFQNTEAHGGLVLDHSEGTKTVRNDRAHIDLRDPAQWSEVTEAMFGSREPTNVHFAGIDLRYQEISENCMVFCLSEAFSSEAYSAMGDGPAYDCCLRVNDIPAFVDALTTALRARLGELSVSVVRCVYDDRERSRDTDDGVHPAMLKGVEYRGQQEVRILWLPESSHALEPIVLTVPKLASLVSHHHSKSQGT